MKNRNELIRIFREICGEETDEGFFLTVSDIKVPNFINKDDPAEYPEIRITPFLSDKYVTRMEKKISDYKKNVREIYNGKFQIDIYSKSIVEVNEIYQTLIDRIDDFTDPDMISYGYDFIQTEFIDDYYINPEYTIENAIISTISISNEELNKVNSFDELENNTWFLDSNGLYIKTDMNMDELRILTMIDGKVFPDGETANQKGLYNFFLVNYRELSQLERNEVERISFDIELTYAIDKEVKLGPIIDGVYQKPKSG